MKIWFAIPLTIGLIVLSILASALVHFSVVMPMVLLTSLWVAFDSAKLQLSRYKSGISYGPVVMFFACLLLWAVGFPWYLVMRDKILSGTAVLKDGPPVTAA